MLTPVPQVLQVLVVHCIECVHPKIGKNTQGNNKVLNTNVRIIQAKEGMRMIGSGYTHDECDMCENNN